MKERCNSWNSSEITDGNNSIFDFMSRGKIQEDVAGDGKLTDPVNVEDQLVKQEELSNI